MIISVTEVDVKNGLRYKPQDCPIALAACRSIPGKVIIVGTEHLAVYDLDEEGGRKIAKYNLPKSAAEFRRAFDLTGTGQPFEFELGDPVP